MGGLGGWEDGSQSGQCRQVRGQGAHVQALKVSGHQCCAQVQGTDESERYSRGQATHIGLRSGQSLTHPWTQTPGKYPCHSLLGSHQAGG